MRLFDCHCSFGFTREPGLSPCERAEDLLARMDRQGIERALVLHEALRTSCPTVGNEIAVRECAASPRLLPAWAILPSQTGEFPEPEALFERMESAGVRALWALPADHRYRLDALTFGDLFEAMSERRAPLFLHQDDNQGGGSGWDLAGRLLADFPALPLVVVGHGPWGDDRSFRPLLDRYPGLHIDISRYELDLGLARLVERYGADRLVFGTGAPKWAMGGPATVLREAPIPVEAKEAIGAANLERLLGWAGDLPPALPCAPDPSVRTLGGDRFGEFPVLDAHGHFGPFQKIWFPNRTGDDMVRTLDRCGVKAVVSSHHDALSGDAREGNAKLVRDGLESHPGRVFGYWVWDPFRAEENRAALRGFPPHPGFVGFKIHPTMHRTPMTDERYKALFAYANVCRVPVLSHTWGGSEFDGPALIERIASDYPDMPFLLGHSCFGEWDRATALARAHPNVYLELTAAYAVAGVIEKLVTEAGADRVLFGEDLPWFDPMYGIGCVLGADIADEDKRKILYTNAASLFPAAAGM